MSGDGAGLVHGAGVAQVFGCAGAVLSVGLNAPQAWTSCVGRRVAGLSPAARWMAVGQAATWLVYGLAEQIGLQVVTNAVCLTLHLSVLAALLVLDPSARSRPVLAPQAAAMLGWLAAVVACALTGAAPVGTLAAAVGAVSVVPQLWRLARDRTADRSGVSVATTTLSLVASLCWAVHGLALGVGAVTLPALVGAVAAAWTLALLRPSRPRPTGPVRSHQAPVVLPPSRLLAA